MQLIKQIRQVWRLSRMLPKFSNPTWTKQEAEQLQAFLASQLGQKIKTVIFSWIVKQSLASIDRGANDAQYNVGYAAGFRDGIGCLDTLVSHGLLADDNDNT